MDFYVSLNSNSIIVGGEGEGATASAAASETAQNGQAPQGGGIFGGVNMWLIILMYVVVLGGYFWFLGRNNKKKEKRVAEMRKALKPGDSVCTTGGFHGKIVDIGEDVFIIEFGTNKGVRIPVIKTDVVAAKEPVLNAPKLDN